MRKKYRVISIITLYVSVISIYILFFVLRIEGIPLFLFLTIGSVAVLSTSTVYTVLRYKGSPYDKIQKKKFPLKPKSIQKKPIEIFGDYYDAMPSIEEYVESNETYKDNPVINKFIFSVFNQEEIDKINLLDLSKMDKIQLIREMVYFDSNERKILIENMLKNQYKKDKEIFYTPPITTLEMEAQIRVYVRSLVESGEKTKVIIIDTSDSISTVKERIALLFDYNQKDFLLSSGGILLNEDLQILDFDIDDDDEIALIPSRKKKGMNL